MCIIGCYNYIWKALSEPKCFSFLRKKRDIFSIEVILYMVFSPKAETLFSIKNWFYGVIFYQLHNIKLLYWDSNFHWNLINRVFYPQSIFSPGAKCWSVPPILHSSGLHYGNYGTQKHFSKIETKPSFSFYRNIPNNGKGIIKTIFPYLEEDLLMTYESIRY